MPDNVDLSSLMQAIDSFGRNTGDYWANDNAKFAATNPNLIQKIVRGVNPMTGFGSAIGQMHDAASQGDKLAMALSAFGAMPAFGAGGKAAVAGARPLIQKLAESAAARTARNLANNTAASMIAEDVAGRDNK